MKSSAWSWRKKLNIDTSAHLLQLKHLYLKPEGKNNQENSLSLEIWCCFLILLLLQTQRLLKHHHPLFLVRFVVTDKICSYCVGFKLLGGHPDTFTETEPHGQRSDGGSDQMKQSTRTHLLCRGEASSSFFLIICRRTRHVRVF